MKGDSTQAPLKSAFDKREDGHELKRTSDDNTVREAIEIYTLKMFEAGSAILSTLFNKKISLNFSRSFFIKNEDLASKVEYPWIGIYFSFLKGFSGNHNFIFKKDDAVSFAQMILADEYAAFDDMTSIYEDGMRETFNQMMNKAANALGGLLGRAISFSYSIVSSFEDEFDYNSFFTDREKIFAVATSIFKIEGKKEFEFYFTFSEGLLSEIIPALMTKKSALINEGYGEDFNDIEKQETGKELPPAIKGERNNAQRGANIDMLLDIYLPVTVELGRTRMMIKDILNLAPGSVIELDKLAGEPVDLYINEKSIAKGEVVVIDENFGIRLTHIVNTSERIKNLR